MNSNASIPCAVYRSDKKNDTYLFVREKDDFSPLPQQLRRLLGTLEWVMDLELTPNRALALSDVNAVMESLQQQGYYLQLPPKHLP